MFFMSTIAIVLHLFFSYQFQTIASVYICTHCDTYIFISLSSHFNIVSFSFKSKKEYDLAMKELHQFRRSKDGGV